MLFYCRHNEAVCNTYEFVCWTHIRGTCGCHRLPTSFIQEHFKNHQSFARTSPFLPLPHSPFSPSFFHFLPVYLFLSIYISICIFLKFLENIWFRQLFEERNTTTFTATGK